MDGETLLLVGDIFKALQETFGFWKATQTIVFLGIGYGMYDNRKAIKKITTSMFGDEDDPLQSGTQEELHEMKTEDIPRLEDKTDQTKEEVREADTKIQRVETKVDEMSKKLDTLVESGRREVEKKEADLRQDLTDDD